MIFRAIGVKVIPYESIPARCVRCPTYFYLDGASDGVIQQFKKCRWWPSDALASTIRWE